MWALPVHCSLLHCNQYQASVGQRHVLFSQEIPADGESGTLSHRAKKQAWESLQLSVENYSASDGLRERRWQGFFTNPARWWDSHPGWVKSKLKRPHESVSTHGASYWAAAHEVEVDKAVCRKLCENGPVTNVVHTLDLFVQRGFHIAKSIFYRVLKRCITQKELVLGKRIHALTVETGYEGDPFLATHLIAMYASHGRLGDAMGVFVKVPAPDTYNWATIIFAFARHGESAQALRLYQQMRESGIKPDNHIFLALLKACATAGDLATAKDVHSQVLASEGKPDIFVHTCVVDMYARCGSIEDARRVFDALPYKNVVTYNVMIAAYARQGMGEEALSLYDGMGLKSCIFPDSLTFVCMLQACACSGKVGLYKGKLLHAQILELGLQDNVVVGNSLVSMYSKCGSLGDARRVFDTISHRDVVTWNAMIAGYVQQGMAQDAFCLYRCMQQEGGNSPDSVTFVCLLHACADVAALQLGKQLHSQIRERQLQAAGSVGNSLLHMYAECGSMTDAQQVFDSLSEGDVVAWSALIAGYARQGQMEVVFDLFDRMLQEGTQPDGIVFLSILSVCSHAGLVEKGLEYFEAMSADHGIAPTSEHYTCMIDLFGRACHLDEALRMAKTMPFPPNRAAWLSLLGNCRKWNNVAIGRQAFECAVELDDKDASFYILMSNIYAGVEMWEQAREMQVRRVYSKAWKQPGQSWWTDMGGTVYTFVTRDGHYESESINARLDLLVQEMKSSG